MRFALLPLISLALVAEPPVAERLRADVTYLASPALKGRGHGSEGLEKAADYLVAQYQAMGIAAEKHRYPSRSRPQVAEATVHFEGQTALTHGKAWRLLRPVDVDVQAAGVVPVGVGLTAELEGKDLKGKVAVMRLAAESQDPPAPARLKALLAKDPAAVVLLEDAAKPLPQEQQAALGWMRTPIPVFVMGAAAAGTKPAPTFTARVRHEAKDITVPNVVARIEGSDPALKQEYIAVGGHFDHLGETDAIYPGADDNASGTAMVLDLARRLKQRPPKRSVLLLHFSGEEIGLLGSSAWTKAPTVPLETVKFYFNFDMVGRLDPNKPKLDIGTIGLSAETVARLDAKVPASFAVNHDLGFYLGASDHVNLAAKKVPAVFYFTGMHADYHKPTDTADKLNYEGSAQIEDVALATLREFADAPQVPAFDLASAKWLFPEPTRLSKAVFGALPGEGTDPRGLVLGGVREGTPAAALGLQVGDILVSFDGRPVQRLFDLNAALSNRTAGDKVKVIWIRGGSTHEATVELKAR